MASVNQKFSVAGRRFFPFVKRTRDWKIVVHFFLGEPGSYLWWQLSAISLSLGLASYRLILMSAREFQCEMWIPEKCTDCVWRAADSHNTNVRRKRVFRWKWKCSNMHSFLNQDIISNFRNYPDLLGFKTLLSNKIMDKKWKSVSDHSHAR